MGDSWGLGIGGDINDTEEGDVCIGVCGDIICTEAGVEGDSIGTDGALNSFRVLLTKLDGGECTWIGGNGGTALTSLLLIGFIFESQLLGTTS